jgi:hypothetical protein
MKFLCLSAGAAAHSVAAAKVPQIVSLDAAAAAGVSTEELARLHADAARGINILVSSPAYHAPILGSVAAPAWDAAAPRDSANLPAVIVHGMGDAGTNPGMKSICKTVGEKYPGTFTLCSTTADGAFSITDSMPSQVEKFTAEVRSHPELAHGFNAVGLSCVSPFGVRAFLQQPQQQASKHEFAISD